MSVPISPRSKKERKKIHHSSKRLKNCPVVEKLSTEKKKFFLLKKKTKKKFFSLSEKFRFRRRREKCECIRVRRHCLHKNARMFVYQQKKSLFCRRTFLFFSKSVSFSFSFFSSVETLKKLKVMVGKRGQILFFHAMIWLSMQFLLAEKEEKKFS